jgi:hypothetical protein
VEAERPLRIAINAGPRTSAGCFAKGTPVHTLDGLTPIDEIRVGDLVLSAPEDGTGTPAYRRVVDTFVHQRKTIRKISTYAPESGTQYFVAATATSRSGWRAKDGCAPTCSDVTRCCAAPMARRRASTGQCAVRRSYPIDDDLEAAGRGAVEVTVTLTDEQRHCASS